MNGGAGRGPHRTLSAAPPGLRAAGLGATGAIRFGADLKPARALALDDDLAVLRAQFDLSNVTPCRVCLLGDEGRALQAGSSLALRYVSARMNANGRRSGIKIWLKHDAYCSGGSISPKRIASVSLIPGRLDQVVQMIESVCQPAIQERAR